MYYANLDQQIDSLFENGAVKLPSVKEADWRDVTYKDCLKQIGNKSFGENLPANLSFLNKTKILDTLLPKLAEAAKTRLKINVNINDVYNVCRLVRPGDTAEGYRGHFDSHLFTLVTPINIPDLRDVKNSGELHYYPYARRQPKNELHNIFGKAFFKKNNSELGFSKLAESKPRIVDDFKDYKPLLFLGNTTFHGNSPVSLKSVENRMTILTHFFDPSPKVGLGNLMRMLRKR